MVRIKSGQVQGCPPDTKQLLERNLKPEKGENLPPFLFHSSQKEKECFVVQTNQNLSQSDNKILLLIIRPLLLGLIFVDKLTVNARGSLISISS